METVGDVRTSQTRSAEIPPVLISVEKNPSRDERHFGVRTPTPPRDSKAKATVRSRLEGPARQSTLPAFTCPRGCGKKLQVHRKKGAKVIWNTAAWFRHDQKCGRLPARAKKLFSNEHFIRIKRKLPTVELYTERRVCSNPNIEEDLAAYVAEWEKVCDYYMAANENAQETEDVVVDDEEEHKLCRIFTTWLVVGPLMEDPALFQKSMKQFLGASDVEIHGVSASRNPIRDVTRSLYLAKPDTIQQWCQKDNQVLFITADARQSAAEHSVLEAELCMTLNQLIAGNSGNLPYSLAHLGRSMAGGEPGKAAFTVYALQIHASIPQATIEGWLANYRMNTRLKINSLHVFMPASLKNETPLIAEAYVSYAKGSAALSNFQKCWAEASRGSHQIQFQIPSSNKIKSGVSAQLYQVRTGQATNLASALALYMKNANAF